ncbi:uncharacterized protein LOC132269140 [Cornus florida]|uniref:uncharacterized protein LOC132269140 n=1 Tax=Cornus florida TaxID=4283 RepID=UPI002899C4B0|nr:uncharacterized protein LOC132269140 [Cornus florida]
MFPEDLFTSCLVHLGNREFCVARTEFNVRSRSKVQYVTIITLKISESMELVILSSDVCALNTDGFGYAQLTSLCFNSQKAFKILGIGIVKIKTHNGLVRTLSDVRQVPDLKMNLISVGVLDSKGYKFVTEGGVMMVVMDSLVVLQGTKVKNLYILQENTVTGGASTGSFTASRNLRSGLGKRRVRKRCDDPSSQKGCEGTAQHGGRMKSVFRWQPKLQQSLQGGRPMRTGVILTCNNLDGNKIVHSSAIKMRGRQVVGHNRDARKSQGRPILHKGEMMTFHYQSVVCGRLEKVAEGDVKLGISEVAFGKHLEFDTNTGGMFMAAQDIHGLKNESPRVKFEDDSNLTKILN